MLDVQLNESLNYVYVDIEVKMSLFQKENLKYKINIKRK